MLSLYKRRRNPSNGEYTYWMHKRQRGQIGSRRLYQVWREQIAPEIVQAIIAQAAARGLSVNDYLR
jgi:phage gp46-like protein